MISNGDEHSERDWTETTALAAPALLGTAAGLLLGELMHRSARRGVALGLGILGASCLIPFAVSGIVNKVNGPLTNRGARRRLTKIRDAGAGDKFIEESLSETGII
jgi:hypothetical protein